jgi:hypothetical protein
MQSLAALHPRRQISHCRADQCSQAHWKHFCHLIWLLTISYVHVEGQPCLKMEDHV